jgi:hypothetical protein
MDPAALQALARHAEAVATVRAFAAGSGAARVVLVLDTGRPGDAAMVEWAGDGTVALTEGDAIHTIAPGMAVPALARPLPELRPAPASALSLDAESGELAAPIGAIHHLADGVLALARAFGGRTVATADFATRDPQVAITLAARDGEPTILAVGEESFELPG